MSKGIIAITDSGKVVNLDNSDFELPTEVDIDKMVKAEALKRLKRNIESMSPSEVLENLDILGISCC